ncbi:DNA-3-methyladenine glycosylase [Sporolactobacillus spathodeae]|uniref:Putative 3-methyladenine DNA glycosylase n=1 Tax=Sporolactobacillus spathodeae TaxID=1465502 RepID=A0ABS2Q543_9BACL|nr:DNA-3-methyladenine glycosylase [Sporolactobacillus spathodeae]MBM7656902.1 DNA-3-methyladenine glycosylase [Sporolactobacillus spathodeae]
MYQPLPIDFYQRPTLELAKALLGCLLVKETPEGIASGYILETEAYLGAGDRAAHSFGNRHTKRTAIMYAAAGHVYTYTMHTHTLINVVAEPEGTPHAILIRAVEPVDGIKIIEARRLGRKRTEWTNGPGKLTDALGITMQDYGHLLTKPPLYLCAGLTPNHISSGPRIGIENSGEARLKPWRFWITAHPGISKK